VLAGFITQWPECQIALRIENLLSIETARGKVRAIAGALSIMVGGAAAALEKVKPAFACLGKNRKDMNIVMQSAHELGLCLPATAAATQMFNAMVGSGLGDEDSVAMLKLLETLSGTED
jgi:3-hydroxyisobutyrate dehydrogenase-like beta-hydroxyacid dehydrogenase